MITLDVYFVKETYIGTAYLVENLITDDIQLEISDKVFIHEIKAIINKAVNKLKKRYEKVNVDIHWDTANNEEESDK